MNCIFLKDQSLNIYTMFAKTEKQFALLFSIIVILELVSNSKEALFKLHYIVKPLIVLSLIGYVIWEGKTLQSSRRSLLLLALICSMLGDILLMFNSQNQQFFIFGLIAFLVAHIMYILLFLKDRNREKNALPFALVLLIYATALFYLLKEGLGEMLVPVIAYMLVILTMASTAFLRKDKVSKQSYLLIFIGALLFMLSDSLLALNMFYKPIPMANFAIMITYALAQFFIVIGILRQPKAT